MVNKLVFAAFRQKQKNRKNSVVESEPQYLDISQIKIEEVRVVS